MPSKQQALRTMVLTYNDLPDAVGKLFEKLNKIEEGIAHKLAEITQQPADDLIPLGSAAKFLDLANATIYSLVSQNKIPYMKRGNKLYFSRSELADWIKKGRIKTIDEITKDADQHLVDVFSLNEGGDKWS